jgi:hypothetical protein
MSVPEPDRVQRFKAEIGYQRVAEALAAEPGVALDWPDAAEWADLKDDDWQTTRDSVKVWQGNALRRWNLQKGGGLIEVEVFVSSVGPAAALQHFLDATTSTTMARIPYTKGPEDLGHLAVWGISDQPCFLVWVFHNVCFRIIHSDLSADVTPMARWIQEQAAENVVPRVAERAPKIAGLELSSERIAVGERLTVRVKAAEETDPERLQLTAGSRRQRLRWAGRDGLALQFEGLEPGAGEAEVVLLDRKNLLCAARPVRVEVVAPEG